MPRNISEKDPAKKHLLAWAKAAQAALEYPAFDSSGAQLEELRRRNKRRSELRREIPPEGIRDHFHGRHYVRDIVASIYAKYGQPDGT